ncbi:MAG: hypothetical protein ACLR0U_04235 [Enterocloster clostridioformis]
MIVSIEGLTLREIEKEIKGKIADKLVKYETTTSGVQDKRWYYIAPLLLDGAGYVYHLAEQRR